MKYLMTATIALMITGCATVSVEPPSCDGNYQAINAEPDKDSPSLSLTIKQGEVNADVTN